MRGKLSRMWRASISLMLVFCMLVSMAPAAFAVDSGSEQTTINYVSLGDSVSLGSGSYPNLFASWLVEEGYAVDVEHSALTMEAMRAEDLHFILTYSGANSAVAEAEEFNEAAWNNAFSAGDYYTWKNFTSNGIITAEVAKQYQAAVAAADLLTVGIGNANFGDFLMDCAMDAVNGELAWVDVENAMGDLNASLKTELTAVYNKLLAKLEAQVGNEMAVSLANAMVYTMVGCVVNYEAALDEIVAMNPDVEIIIVPVINTMDGVKLTYNGNTYDIGSYIDDGLKALNAYLALVATKYENTIFYAEVGEVELQGNVADALPRADIIDTIVGENGDGMIWEMMADKVGSFYEGAKLVPITEAQVAEYEGLDAADKANYVIDADTNAVNSDKVNEAISLSLYLAFEEAIKASQGKALSVEGLKDLADSEALINSVVANVTAKLDNASAQYEDEAYAAIADLVNTKLEEELAAKDITYDANLDEEDIKTLMADSEECEALIQELAFDIAAAGINTELGTDLNVEQIKALYNGTVAEEYPGLMDDLVYAGIAKNVTESEDSDIQKYKAHLDTAEEVKALFTGGEEYVFGKAIELVKDELSKTLGKELTAAQIEVLYGGDKTTIEETYPGLLEELSVEAAYVVAAEELEKETGDVWTKEDVKELENYTAQDVYQKVADNSDGKLSIDEVSHLHNDTDGTYTEGKAYELVAEEAGIELAELVGLVNGDAAVIAKKAVEEGGFATEAEFLDLYNLDTTSADVVINYMVATADEETSYEELKSLYDAKDSDFMDAYKEVVDAHDDAVQFVSDKQAEAKDAIKQATEGLEEVVKACNEVFDAQAELKNTLLNEKERIQGELIKNVQDGVDTAVNTLNTEVIGKKGEAETEILNTVKKEIDENAIPTLKNEVLPTIRTTVNNNIDNLCKMLAVSEAVVAAVEEDAALTGMLSIMARCLIGDGLGFLPTADGHKTIAEAVEKAYKDKHTVQDETKENVDLALDKVIEVLEENGMNITATAIQNGLDYITDLDGAVADLKAELQKQIDDYKSGIMPALQTDLAAMQELLTTLENKLAALETKLAGLEAKLNDLNNTPDAAASAIEALEKAIAETNSAISATKEKIAYINTCIASLNEKLMQMSETLADLQAAVEKMDTSVKGVYAAVSTKDLSFHDAFNHLETARQGAIEAISEVEELYHQLKDLGNDAIKFIDTVKDEVTTAVTILGGAMYVAYKLLPESVEAKIKAEAEAKIDDLKAQIEEKKAELEQEVKEEVKAELQKQIDALEAEIDAVEAKAAEDIESLGGVNEDAVNLINEVLDDTYNAIYAEWENVEKTLKLDIDAKNDVLEASAQAIKNLVAFAEEEVDKVIEEAKAIYADVINAEYTITDSSYYVALGDASAYSAENNSYVDILAADPQLALEEAYKNAYSERTIDQMLADIRGGDIPADVTTADLITVRFDNSQIVKNAFYHAFTYMKGVEGTDVYTFEWEALIGEKGVVAVNNFLAALEEELEKYGMEDMKLIEMADGATLPAEGRTLDKAFVHMAEAYLYYSIQYMLSIPEYVAEIHKINPDAVIIFVGMSNPFGNTVLTHENLNIEVGNYMGTIVEYVDMIGKGFCMLFPNATYVSAQDVETSASNVEMDLTQFFVTYVQDQKATLYPTEAGHTYIKEQILKALTIIDERSTEPACLLGDVNDDGKVDGRDLTRLARYLAEVPNMVIHELNSDVNLDGFVDGRDLTRLARFLAEVPGVELG